MIPLMVPFGILAFAETTMAGKVAGLPEDAQKVNDLSALCNWFEKKIHDDEVMKIQTEVREKRREEKILYKGGETYEI